MNSHIDPIHGIDDYKLDTQVKWCPGCGGHAILKAVQKVLPGTGVKKENVVFVSGIGCSSRFPYYINTYGFHGIHGRALAIASGIKVSQPELSVWVITGDGDSMAIGGNHLIHTLRRNIDINILMFNNKIYGLTKGQYSPTTPKDSITKTSPDGLIENPFNPGELAMGAESSFFSRVLDNNMSMLQEVLLEAAKHKGTSVIEILENCVIFNNKVHESITGKDVREDHQVYLEHGKPIIYGKNRDKGLIIGKNGLEAVKIGENNITENDILIHDAKDHGNITHFRLARMTLPDFPVAMGVIRNYDSTVYEYELHKQIAESKEKNGTGTLDELFHEGDVFEVK